MLFMTARVWRNEFLRPLDLFKFQTFFQNVHDSSNKVHRYSLKICNFTLLKKKLSSQLRHTILIFVMKKEIVISCQNFFGPGFFLKILFTTII